MNGDPRSLKEALYETIHGYRHGVEALAEELNMTKSYLYRSALPDEDERDSGVRFPLKQLIPLTRATGDFRVLNYIERSLHRITVPYPAQVARPETLQRDAIKAAAEFGEMMSEIHARCGDGELTRKDRERIFREGWEAVEAIMCVIVGCEEGICNR